MLRQAVDAWQASSGEHARARMGLLLRVFQEQLVRMQDLLAEDPAMELPLDYPAAIDHLHTLTRSDGPGERSG